MEDQLWKWNFIIISETFLYQYNHNIYVFYPNCIQKVFALNELELESKSKWNEWDPMESKFPIPFNTAPQAHTRNVYTVFYVTQLR